MIIVFLIAFLHLSNGQSSQWIDIFQKSICHQRWYQMDWLSIIRPCRHKMDFGKSIDEKQKTSTKWSHTLGLHFAKTGEFSKLAIQSRKPDGRNKEIGGDTWRVFIRGADMITPFISDLDNGVYEADFIVMQPGFYKVEIALEATLCQAYEDPPPDWLKRDEDTIISDEKAQLVWQPLRGGNISFKIELGSNETIKELQRNFYHYKDSCGSQYNCEMLWNGIGRWSNSTWIPYIDDKPKAARDTDGCYKQKEGILTIVGDELTKSFSDSNHSFPLCHEIFSGCRWNSGREKPKVLNSTNSSQTTSIKKTFSVKSYLQNLKELLKEDYMDESSGLILNYGHPFVKNLGFMKYRSFIDRVVRIVTEKYKGHVVWQTMASIWRESYEAENHFRNHQRIKLFNAYATSVMCNAGIPVLDVFQMTESAPTNDESAVVKNIGKMLTRHFKYYPSKQCPKKKEIPSSNVTQSELTRRSIDNTPIYTTASTENNEAIKNTGNSKLEIIDQF